MARFTSSKLAYSSPVVVPGSLLNRTRRAKKKPKGSSSQIMQRGLSYDNSELDSPERREEREVFISEF